LAALPSPLAGGPLTGIEESTIPEWTGKKKNRLALSGFGWSA
jgi:hypothetical protein